MSDTLAIGLQALEIIWINLLLSGDNAIVIALACRSLPERQRTWGTILGAGAAVVLRIGFSLVVADLSRIPFLRIVGGLLLIWIAVGIVTDDHGKTDVAPSRSLWGAVRTVAIADAVMSLDNVVAIAMAAKNNYALIVFGLVLSIPLVVFGSRLVLAVLQRFPWLVWGGAALLGWIAGDIVSDDPVVVGFIGRHAHAFDRWAPVLFTAIVLAVTAIVLRLKKRSPSVA